MNIGACALFFTNFTRLMYKTHRHFCTEAQVMKQRYIYVFSGCFLSTSYAHPTGSRILQSDDDDTLSVYVFGEEEEHLQQEAMRNDGYLTHEHIQEHYGRPQVQKVRRVYQ